MKSRWKMRAECFKGPGSYTLKFAATEGGEDKIPVAVDENRYFELDREPLPGMYSVAQMVSGVQPKP